MRVQTVELYNFININTTTSSCLGDVPAKRKQYFKYLNYFIECRSYIMLQYNVSHSLQGKTILEMKILKTNYNTKFEK